MEAVRTATIEDVPRLLELVGELAATVTSLRGGSMLVDPDRPQPWLHGDLAPVLAMIEDDRALVAVGTLDSVATGLLLCHLEELGGHGRRGVLDACYVEPEARGVGLGHLLMDTALAWFREQSCLAVDGVALPGDRGAKNFYESAGFKARMLTMHRRLD